MRCFRFLLSALFLVLAASVARAEFQLLMAEQAGCVYCDRWKAEVGDAYHKTEEGKAAPVTHYDRFNGPPEGIELSRPVLYTPTFILVKEGIEIERIEGYPGEDFFWGILRVLLERHNAFETTTHS